MGMWLLNFHRTIFVFIRFLVGEIISVKQAKQHKIAVYYHSGTTTFFVWKIFPLKTLQVFLKEICQNQNLFPWLRSLGLS